MAASAPEPQDAGTHDGVAGLGRVAAAPGSELAMFTWPGGGVVHDGRSNDTWRLADDALALLAAVQGRGPTDAAELARRTGLPADRLAALVDELEPLGLIRSC